ncbi:MAG: site-2 protease family protein [Clostridiales bacterium]|nr:site-2 protease family protein [Clostridiales bacterium]
MDRFIEYFAIFLALLIVLPFHEFAHAFVAVKSGDMTPKLYNRYTLNPMAHFDATGILCFLFFRFGWAKPVPVNPNNFKNYKKGCFFVSIAGVLMNYIIAFIAYPLFILAVRYVPIGWSYFGTLICLFPLFLYSLSINFFVFNLLPLYPLDGFRVLDVLTKKRGKLYYFLRNNGQKILLGLILLGIIAELTGFYYIDILGNVMGFLNGIFSYPITLFWGFVFGAI